MPITAFQKDMLQLLAANRKPESHLAGGTAINRADSSPRYSADIDFFQDLADDVFAAAQADAALLASQGYTVTWMLRQPYLQRVSVRRGDEALKLEWCYDSSFRFFPVQPDPEFGYCLHPADLSTNKVLAMAGRSEIRDFIDILYLHETYLSLGAISWAACGKDLGFNPCSLLDFAKRHMKFREDDLAGEHLVRPVCLTDLKEDWHTAVAQAEGLIAELPAAEVGCLYLSPSFSPITPDPAAADFSVAIRHFCSIRGAWPTVAP
ncbi:MAG: hypothetical protein EXR98_16265 [Gemmataceae bacterium]|nr:hypothetical protein [Gemmataceae bacterium]